MKVESSCRISNKMPSALLEVAGLHGILRSHFCEFTCASTQITNQYLQ